MSAKSIEEALRQCERELAGSRFPPGVKRRTPGCLRRSIRVFRELSTNQDGRGLKHAVKRRICRAVDRLRCAVRHAYEHEDANIRTKAKALVRSIQALTFDELDQRASRFVGLLRRAGHRRKERRLLVSRPTSWIGDLEVAELVSVDQLRSAGRELGLCVAHANDTGRVYHDALRSGESKFYRLAKEGRAIGLVEVDVDEMHVADAQGSDGCALPLSRKLALDLLRQLEITADDVDAFSRVGAFSVFLDGTPKIPAISFAGCTYRVWTFPDAKRIAVSKTRGTRSTVSWSLFERRDPKLRGGRRRRLGRPRPASSRRDVVSRTLEPRPLGTWVECCYHDDAMCVGEFTDLLIRCPDVARIVGEAI